MCIFDFYALWGTQTSKTWMLPLFGRWTYPTGGVADFKRDALPWIPDNGKNRANHVKAVQS